MDQGGLVESANGDDIIFRKSDGQTGLYHEIETHDAINGKLWVWVRYPSLSKAADTTIYMYYGNACIAGPTANADADEVWDAHYKGVWHLKENGSGTADEFVDSSGNSSDGQGEGTVPNFVTAGKISISQYFDGGARINFGSGNLDQLAPMTFTTWIKPDTYPSNGMRIFEKRTSGDAESKNFYITSDTEQVPYHHFRWVQITSGAQYSKINDTVMTEGEWYHVALTWDGTLDDRSNDCHIYINGVKSDDGGSDAPGETTLSEANGNFYLGDRPNGDRSFEGWMDEARYSNKVLADDWIMSEFNNQDDAAPGTGNFIKSLGSQETGFTTAIDLLSFTADGQNDTVQVAWETASETGNLGFYLYRSDSAAGPFVRITDQLIAGFSLSTEERQYAYADTDVISGQTYYYKLEDLDIHGQRTFHGPVGVDWDGAGAPLVAPGDPAPAPWGPGGDAGPVTVSDTDEPVYKIMVDSEGIHRLTRDYLAGQGVALGKVDLSKVRLYHQAREVAIWVHDDNGDTVFDAADHITFYALPVGDEYAKYSADNVYWLTTGAGANPVKRMTAVDSAPDGSALAAGFEATVRSEQDQYYYPAAPGADEFDRWLNETWIVGAEISWPGAGDPITFTLDTPGATGSGTLTVALLGTYDTDHQVDIAINGGPAQTFSWSGIAFYEAVVENAALVDGVNTISLTCQTGLDALLLDWLAPDYPRNFAADNDQLNFTSSSPERFLVTDFAGAGLLAFDITDPQNVSRSINFSTGGSGPYSLEFTPPNGAAEARTYQALSEAALLTPRAMSADAASNLTDAANGADYILITHRNLGWDGSGNQNAWLTDLLAHRQAQGHRVMAVNLTDIYDEFAFGLATPAAIQDFLAYAVSFWTAPAPRFVLLVGDATYDYKDNWGYGAADDVPAYTIYSEEAGETVTDEWYVLNSGGDVVPDLYIGRLPAATAAEAGVMAADNQTWYAEAIFESMNEDAADLLPAALQPPFRAYLDDYGTAAALNADLIAQIDAGSLLLNYSGHASVQVWAAENIFDNSDVAGLANAGRYPVIVSMSCLSGYFAYPAAWNFPSMSEVLLRAEDKGAVGMLVPTGQTNPNYQAILNEALFEAIFKDDVRQIGAAIGRAKQILLQNNPGQAELSQTFLLFGDPAMVLQVPLPRRPAGLAAELTAGGTVDLAWSSALDANGGGGGRLSPLPRRHGRRPLDPAKQQRPGRHGLQRR